MKKKAHMQVLIEKDVMMLVLRVGGMQISITTNTELRNLKLQHHLGKYVYFVSQSLQ